jgi:DNA helicase-4
MGSNGNENTGSAPQSKQTQIRAILKEIASKHSKADVFLIGRYHRNIPEGFIELKKQYKQLDIQYHTAHKVKGMTCDYAILLDLDSGMLGFPSEMADDPLLNHLLHEGDQFDNAEERRVFYVAITRAKHKNYLLFDTNNPSKFVIELQEALGVQLNDVIRCPECNGNMVKRKGRFNEFYGCVNYPHCEGKRPIQISSEKQMLTQI